MDVNPKKSKAYAYARVSSEHQAEKGTSIQSQLELMRKHASQNNITILKEFIDEAESATTDLRPQFQEMIGLSRDNPQGIESILVWKLSRFARNRIDSVVYKKLLSKQGVRVISVSEPIDDSPEGRMLEGIIEVMDGYYSEILSKETMRGLKQAAKQGYHTGGKPPYGYKLKGVNVGNITKKVWEIHEKEAEAVRLVFGMHSKGHTYKDIIIELDKNNHSPRKTKRWGNSTIYEILRKPCYSGTHYFNTRKRKELGKRVHLRDAKDKSEWIPIKVPRIVDQKTFEAVKAKLGKRKFKAPRRSTTQILSGLLVCGKCQQPYVIGDYYRRKYPYYRCSTKMKQGTSVCDNRNLRGDQIEVLILKEIRKKVFSETNLKKYKQIIEQSVKDEKKELQHLVSRLSKEDKEIEAKKKVYYDGLETGKLELNLVNERLEELKAQGERISIQRHEAEKRLTELPQPEDYKITKKEYVKLQKSLTQLIEQASAHHKRQFLSKFINTITVYPDKIVVEYIPPRIKKGPSQKDSDLSVIPLASPTGFEPVLPA